MIDVTEFLFWLFGLSWWKWFKVVSNIGAPAVAVIGIAWYLYDRYTGGI